MPRGLQIEKRDRKKRLKINSSTFPRLKPGVCSELILSSASDPALKGRVGRRRSIKIRGRIVEGLRVSANFTQVPWVRNQFISRLSIDPYPGTLNLEIVGQRDLEKFKKLKATRGVEITPEDPSFCTGRCYPVLIGGKLKGAIIFPAVEDYPENKMELISPANIKEALSANSGDFLEVETL
jgi:CTP-dependent riboflavin kinase